LEFDYVTPKVPMVLEQWIRLVFPVRCIICDTVMPQDSSLLICKNCNGVLEFEEPRWRPCFEWPEIEAWYCPFPYAGGIEHAIRQMKYHNQPKHAETLSCILAETVLRIANVNDIVASDRVSSHRVSVLKEYPRLNREEKLQLQFSGIIPVPMHSSKVRTRGYNQAVLLSKNLGGYLDIPVYEWVVKKTVRRHAQNGLSREERFQVLRNSFSPVSGGEVPKEPNILLVDDVVTTGSTLRSCAMAIIEAYRSVGLPREKVHIYALCVAYA